MVKLQHCCWTLFEDDPRPEAVLAALFAADSRHVYTVFQLEKCPTVNRHHWQGYSEFNCQLSTADFKRIVRELSIHVEPKKGSREQARDYCMKEESRAAGHSPHEVGEWRNVAQGKRTDLDAVKAFIDANPLCSDFDLYDNFFSLCAKHMEFFRKYRAMRQPKRTEMPEVHIFYGAAGTGKSKLASEMAPEAYRKPAGKWWDGYNGEKDVIMDDFDPSTMPYLEWLKICDRYSLTVEVKGGHCRVDQVKRYFFTSNKNPADWYSACTEYDSAAFSRRIFSLKHFARDGTVTDVDISALFGAIVL